MSNITMDRAGSAPTAKQMTDPNTPESRGLETMVLYHGSKVVIGFGDEPDLSSLPAAALIVPGKLELNSRSLIVSDNAPDFDGMDDGTGYALYWSTAICDYLFWRPTMSRQDRLSIVCAAQRRTVPAKLQLHIPPQSDGPRSIPSILDIEMPINKAPAELLERFRDTLTEEQFSEACKIISDVSKDGLERGSIVDMNLSK